MLLVAYRADQNNDKTFDSNVLVGSANSIVATVANAHSTSEATKRTAEEAFQSTSDFPPPPDPQLIRSISLDDFKDRPVKKKPKRLPKSVTMSMLQTGWVTPRELLPHLEVGDMVEFDRSHTSVPYYHWALYIGMEDGIKSVIHLSTEYGDFGLEERFDSMTEMRSKLSGGTTAHVRVDKFIDVAGESIRCRINNYLDAQYTPFPPAIIVDRAMKKLGDRGYHLIFNNCEQFVKWCRYGRPESDQALSLTSIATAAGALVVGGSLPAAVIAGASYYTAIRVGRSIVNRLLPPPSII